MLAVLYAIAMFVLLVYGLNLLWLAWRQAASERTLPGAAPEPAAAPAPDGSWPDVTVQLPLYNEPYVAERLIDACAALAYPARKLEIQVLDDSTDDTTARVARRVAYWQGRGIDILHIHRPDRDGYKAGALQNGLRLARGTLIALFDADFIPPADFLLRTVPHVMAPGVGMVQARWGHLNAADGLLTRLQALGLDAHFAVEQRARSFAGCFINFNGTAGVWQRACIEDAGGWQADTLTEDLDLSYRAQLRGWAFRYLHDVEVPAELPPTIGAFRTQQFRWAKGAVETAMKLTGLLWRSDQPRLVKLEGTVHLAAHVAFPFILLAALLHAPLVLLQGLGYGPGSAYFAWMGLGLFGFAGFFLAQLFAQRTLHPDWGRRLLLLPLFMAGSMGMALNNTQAVLQAILRTRTPFMRTPKNRLARRSGDRAEGGRIPTVAWLEAALAVYCLIGAVALTWRGEWAALPFQFLFAAGFGMVAVLSVWESPLSQKALAKSASAS